MMKILGKIKCGLIILSIVSIPPVSFAQSPLPSPDVNQKTIKDHYGKLPVHFIKNQGQMDSNVEFYVTGPAGSLFFTRNEIVTELVKREKMDEKKESKEPGLNPEPKENLIKEKRLVLRRKFIRPDPELTILGEEELPGKINIFRGNDPDKWKSGIPTYARIRYQNIYPGMDLVFYGSEGRLKYEFHLAPGKNHRSIRFQLDGMDRLKLSETGDLVLETAFGPLIEKKPVAYQMIKDGKIDIPSSYTIIKKNQIGYRIGKYNRSYPLWIDPGMDLD